jgi:hypothetical protein
MIKQTTAHTHPVRCGSMQELGCSGAEVWATAATAKAGAVELLMKCYGP